MKKVRHLPRTWEKITGIRIFDPDGWRSPYKSFNAPIDKEEWGRRMIRSTVFLRKLTDSKGGSLPNSELTTKPK